MGRNSSRSYLRSGRSMMRPIQSQPTIPSTTRVLRSHTAALTQVSTPAHTVLSSGIGTEKKSTKRRKRLDPWYPKRKINPSPKPRAPPPTHFTCRICISYLPSADFVRWVPLKRRVRGKGLDAPSHCIPHLARNPYRRAIDPVCKKCIGLTMAARLDMLGARKVSAGCLEPGCQTDWSWDLVMKYFPREKLEAFNLAAFEHWRADADLFACLSPTCDSVGILDELAPGYPQVQCHSSTCKFRSCASCNIAWHPDQTCAEVVAVRLDAQMSSTEKETLTLMQSKDGRRCPNCSLVIEKDGGCPSMYCPGCNTFFNWDTAASAVPGSKKALPIARGQGYWETARQVVCESDGLEKTAEDGQATAGDLPMNRGSELETGWLQMPLPNEQDADL